MLGKAFIMLATMNGGDGQPVKAPVVKPAPVIAKAPIKAVTKTTPDPIAKVDPKTPDPKAGTATPVVINADYVVGKLQTYYQNIKQYRATFTQQVTNATFGNTSQASGRVYIKKPGKMRWDYQSPSKSSYISDGRRLWSVDHKKKQVVKMDLRQYVMSVAETFLYGKGDLRRDFSSTLLTDSKAGAKGDHVVLLRPRMPDARYKTLTLVVDPKDFRVKKSIIVTTQKETNMISFFSPDTKRPVKDGWFFFNEAKFKGKYKIIEPGKKRPK